MKGKNEIRLCFSEFANILVIFFNNFIFREVNKINIENTQIAQGERIEDCILKTKIGSEPIVMFLKQGLLKKACYHYYNTECKLVNKVEILNIIIEHSTHNTHVRITINEERK